MKAPRLHGHALVGGGRRDQIQQLADDTTKAGALLVAAGLPAGYEAAMQGAANAIRGASGYGLRALPKATRPLVDILNHASMDPGTVARFTEGRRQYFDALLRVEPVKLTEGQVQDLGVLVADQAIRNQYPWLWTLNVREISALQRGEVNDVMQQNFERMRAAQGMSTEQLIEFVRPLLSRNPETLTQDEWQQLNIATQSGARLADLGVTADISGSRWGPAVGEMSLGRTGYEASAQCFFQDWQTFHHPDNLARLDQALDNAAHGTWTQDDRKLIAANFGRLEYHLRNRPPDQLYWAARAIVSEAAGVHLKSLRWALPIVLERTVHQQGPEQIRAAIAASLSRAIDEIDRKVKTPVGSPDYGRTGETTAQLELLDELEAMAPQ